MNATQTELSILVWETGVIGLFLFLLFFYFIYQDAKSLSRNDSFPGIVAVGWSGVVIIVVLSIPYKNIMVFNVIGFLFWYFSGYVMAMNRLQSKVSDDGYRRHNPQESFVSQQRRQFR